MLSYSPTAVLGSALLAIATPAIAEPREAPPISTTSAAAIDGAARSATRVAASEQRYCIDRTITGSWIPHRICDTRAGWLTFGFDPLATK